LNSKRKIKSTLRITRPIIFLSVPVLCALSVVVFVFSFLPERLSFDEMNE